MFETCLWLFTSLHFFMRSSIVSSFMSVCIPISHSQLCVPHYPCSSFLVPSLSTSTNFFLFTCSISYSLGLDGPRSNHSIMDRARWRLRRCLPLREKNHDQVRSNMPSNFSALGVVSLTFFYWHFFFYYRNSNSPHSIMTLSNRNPTTY